MLDWLRSLLRSRFRLSARLYFGLGGAVFLTVAASLVGWFFFNRVGSVQSRVNEGSVPEMVAAFGVAQYSNSLIAAAPRLTTAATPEELTLVSAEIAETRLAFEAELAALEGADTADTANDPIERVRVHADTLNTNIEAISTDRSELFELARSSEALRAELADWRARLDTILIPAIDDQLFYTMTGYRDITEPPEPRSEHLSEDEFNRYRHLADILADGKSAVQILSSAFSIQDAASIEPLRERFESATGRIERSLAALDLEGFTSRAELAPIFDRLLELGAGEESGFDLRADELEIVERQRDLLTRNRDISIDLVAVVDGLVSAANESVQEATRASTQAILTGRTLLLVISVVSVLGAVLIAWLYVGRRLLRRIGMLSQWMRQMAGGDLEVRVDIGGRDEVADMAADLEVFRSHSLEAQRLNLVEQLAEQLQQKNGQLERALDDLHQAQDQIVAREKLAALGELTAGVAHEVRNPLNFVKNFSEVSEELLVELREVISEVGEHLDEDQQSLIAEITDDLTSNLERIRSHGNRADRIVNDMLMMGRSSTEWRASDINMLLDEHARLAYHSARATDPNFQLDMEQDFDPEMGELVVIPQDLSRVFLNMVGNACYATDEKRRAIAEAPKDLVPNALVPRPEAPRDEAAKNEAPRDEALENEAPGDEAAGDEAAKTEAAKDAGPYVPMLWLATKRGEDSCEIRIKDNGNGIPADIVEKIFNPFFTTKPTGQGTGLGLAMSGDIVREHGGTIRVRSEPGQFTEMIIELPLQRPAPAEEHI